MKPLEERIKIAQTASVEELWRLVRDAHPVVIMNAALNKNLTEEMAVFIAKKKNTQPEVIVLLANNINFKDCYKLKLAICKNPKTPQKITLSLLKFLRIFDLGDLTKNRNIPINIRQKIEYSIYEKILFIPSGNKIALSKRANSNIVMAIMEKGDKKVINACLDSPALTEGHLFTAISKPNSKPLLIKMIAENPKWSLRYSIRYALIRNFHTPMPNAAKFITNMKTADLKELYSDRNLPSSSKPFIYRELLERGESVDITEAEIYELSDDDVSCFHDDVREE
jgi:hypothetical protein